MMKNNLITKIALGVAVAALLFSIVTLIRALILNNGIFMACILVVGTAIVVAICAIMLYVLSSYEPADDEEEADEQDDTDDKDQAKEIDEAQEAQSEADDITAVSDEPESTIDQEVDEILERLESEGGYDLQNFE